MEEYKNKTKQINFNEYLSGQRKQKKEEKYSFNKMYNFNLEFIATTETMAI